jgi:hypothetical protein
MNEHTTVLQDLKLWLRDKSSFDLFTRLDNKIDELMVKERQTHMLYDKSVYHFDGYFPNHPTNEKAPTQTLQTQKEETR